MRRLGQYEIGVADGSWWVLGWDPSLETFFAQRVMRASPGADERILEDHGLRARELLTVGALEDVLGRSLPPSVARALSEDADGVPGPDPYPMVPWYLRREASPGLDGEHDPVTGNAWRTAVARIAQRMTDWTGERLSTLPAGAVAEALDALGRDAGLPIAPGERSANPPADVQQLAAFASGLGIDRALAVRFLSGAVVELDGAQVRVVCEGLHCSPFDLWGSVLAQGALSMYPPEQWPRSIEPLDAGRRVPATVGEARRLLREFVEARAVADLHVASPPDPVAAVPLGSVSVTAFGRTAILECRPTGEVRLIGADNAPTDPDADYHLAFRQVGDHVGLGELLADGGAHVGAHVAGWDVPQHLADAAQRLCYRLDPPGADDVELVRFTPATGAEVWLHRDPTVGVWELAHDPTAAYPGDPSNVLDPGSWADPGLGVVAWSTSLSDLDGLDLS